MSMADVGAQIHADARNIAIHQTFGHLFPDKGYYGGTVRIAYALYGDIVVMDEKGLPGSSPWWHFAINEFACKASEEMECGEVSEFQISVTIVACEEELEQWQIDEEYEADTWQEIHICQLTKKVLVEAY